MEIAIVDADDARAGSYGEKEIVFIVDFHQGRHAVLLSEFAEATQFGLGEDGGDEQNRVGVVRGGFEDVDSVDGEVLAQDRKSGGCAGGGEVVEAALEVGRVSEHAERRGAALLV